MDLDEAKYAEQVAALAALRAQHAAAEQEALVAKMARELAERKLAQAQLAIQVGIGSTVTVTAAPVLTPSTSTPLPSAASSAIGMEHVEGVPTLPEYDALAFSTPAAVTVLPPPALLPSPAATSSAPAPASSSSRKRAKAGADSKGSNTRQSSLCTTKLKMILVRSPGRTAKSAVELAARMVKRDYGGDLDVDWDTAAGTYDRRKTKLRVYVSPQVC